MAKGMEAQYIESGQFKTVNTYFRPYKIGDDELSMALNVDLREDGRIKQRKGTELVEAIGTNVNLFQFNEIRGGTVTEHLVAIGNGTLYKYNTGTGVFDVIDDTLDASDDYSGIGYVDKFIFANGTKIYKFHYDSGSSSYIVTDLSATTNIPKGTLFDVFASRVFNAGDGTENVYYSNISDPETWDANDFMALSGKIVAIKTVSDFLFIGTDRALYKLSRTGDATLPFQLDVIVNTGVFPDCISEIKSTTVGAMLRDGRFVVFDSYIQSGSQIEDNVGLPVKNIILGIDSTQPVMNINNRIHSKVLFSFHNGETLRDYNYNAINDYTLVFNQDTGGWTFYDLYMKSFCNYNNGEYFSDFSGNVYKFNDTLYQDDGVEFPVLVKTRIFDGGASHMNKNYREYWLTANPLTKTSIKIGIINSYQLTEQKNNTDDFYAYGGEWGEVKWGEFIWGGTQSQVKKSRIDMNGKGLQLWLTKTRDDSDFQITNIIIKYFPSYMKQTI